MSLLTRLRNAFHQPVPPDADALRADRSESIGRVEDRMEELLGHSREGLEDTRSILKDLRAVRQRLAEEPFPIVGEQRGPRA